MDKKMKKRKIMRFSKIFGAVIGGITLMALFAFGFGFIVQLLWNWLMPEIFGLTTITYWQAFGLIILSKLIFGLNIKHSKGYSKKKKWKHYDGCYEDKKGWGKWKYYDEYWKKEGKSAFEKYVSEKEDKSDESLNS